jgi:hypothetical protein
MLENCEMEVRDNILHIKIDLSAPGRPSKNRHGTRNIVIGSSNGTSPIIGQDGKFRCEVINLSVWRKPNKDEIRDFALWRDADQR